MRPLPPPPGRRPRVALYGHDTLGLGHFRRNLALAASFAADGVGADVLILTGAAAAGRFERPAGVDVVALPCVTKDGDGSYAPAHLRQSLDEVVAVRAAVARAALRAFVPDVLVVDKVPLGFQRELADVLPALRRRGTRLVLGLRDVLDEATTARRQWHAERCTESVRTLYDEVWVYGDRDVHDVVATCGMPPVVAQRAHYLGYLGGDTPHSPRPLHARYVLGMAGGGSDGATLAEAFAAAPAPAGHTAVLVTGPYAPADVAARLHDVAARRDDLVVVDFVPDAPTWMAGASAVVTMAGANTVTELLGTDVPALLVPRVRPRGEQLVRARAVAARGMADVALPDGLRAADIAAWLAVAVDTRVERAGIRRDGRRQARRRLRHLLATIVPTSPELHHVAI